MKPRNIILTSAVTAGLILGHVLLYAADNTQTAPAPEKAGGAPATASDSAAPASAKDAENPGWDNGAMPKPGTSPGMRPDGFRKGHPDRNVNRGPEGRPERDVNRGPEGRRDRGPGRQPEGDNPPRDRFAPERDGNRGSDFRPQGGLSPHPGPGFAGPDGPSGPDGPDGPDGPGGPLSRERFGRMGMPPRGPFPDWKELEKCDPEMFNLLKEDAQGEMKTRTLTMQYRQAQGDSKDNIGQQLEEAVKAHFAVRQKRRALELSRLEDELKRMKDLFEKRNQSQDKIIEQRIKALKGDDENLF